jgi:hypothetical protein
MLWGLTVTKYVYRLIPPMLDGITATATRLVRFLRKIRACSALSRRSTTTSNLSSLSSASTIRVNCERSDLAPHAQPRVTTQEVWVGSRNPYPQDGCQRVRPRSTEKMDYRLSGIRVPLHHTACRYGRPSRAVHSRSFG